MQESYDIYESTNALHLEIGERKIRSEQEERMHVQDVRYVERVPVRYMRCTCRTDVHSCTRGVWYNINSKIRKFKTVILSENK